MTDTRVFERFLGQYVDSLIGLSDRDEMAAAHRALVEAAHLLDVPWPEHPLV